MDLPTLLSYRVAALLKKNVLIKCSGEFFKWLTFILDSG